MNWPLTSSVPAIIEIINFAQKNWPHIWWYPNWYLGVPFRFISGPVVPLAVTFISRLGINIENSYLLLIIVTLLFGCIGLFYFVKSLGGGKSSRIWSIILFLAGPAQIFGLFSGNGLRNLALCLLPWVLFFFKRSVKTAQTVDLLLTAIFCSLMLLIDIGSFLSIIVGLIILIFIYKNSRILEEGIIFGLLVILTSLSLATIWYTPQFWLTLLGNPSFGGKPLLNVISFIWQLILSLVPIILGFWIVQKRYKLTVKLTQFAILFLASFGFLTLVRFVSDIDFWMDWLGYSLELQLALSLLLPLIIGRYINKYFVILTTIILLTIGNGFVVYKFYIKDYQARIDYKNQIINLTKDLPKGRIFLSGSTVFWLNNKLNTQLMQVRGNRDEVATHPAWAMGAFAIRESGDRQIVKNWLDIFGVSYILLHKENSHEYFKDFKHQESFTDLNIVKEDSGNVLLSYPVNLVRVADEKLLSIASITVGNDLPKLTSYVRYLENKLTLTMPDPDQIQVINDTTLPQGKIISLSLTYSPNWMIVQGAGKTVRDGVGNLVIIPIANSRDFTLQYNEPVFSWVYGIITSIIFVTLILKKELLIQLFKRKLPALKITTDDEENNY
ncbi:MAG: hypothetical protein UT84_C0009G0021 [Candidatus Curtissbacteria bacterium GW2011_GWA1_40_16]|uniref:Membrane protein 6-pyruvoyl-tetrahydropterin synthase-related domain-containing protein n=1 Tax=Candidatus Curtissbacteria bacterium GW2011_GWA1_40_16 TaxID=1618405 RepID=A0A0G0RD67_9BACT|nr:MAG: hypothetical protein UT84_C0009G0021 [Candidatus Curtissbacteria bacterium GW2011_GWA1_40_16]